MKEDFFKVVTPDAVFQYLYRFAPVGVETISLIPWERALGRVLAEDIVSAEDLPGFDRAVMDGFAVFAGSTFGATEAMPAYLDLVGSVAMGETPEIAINPGQAAYIATGGMLPQGADGVVMIEKARATDTLLEVYQPVAPGANMVVKDEDFKQGGVVLAAGTRLRAQELGLLAALGITEAAVYQQPKIGIISTGDEVVPPDQVPPPGHIRDVNTASLSAMIRQSGGQPLSFGIVPDDPARLKEVTSQAFRACDMVLLSGGSSVGTRDHTLDVLGALPEAEVLVHGISIRPGKPTILASVGGKALWGLPGQVTSAMIVFHVIVRPFLDKLCGVIKKSKNQYGITARASRNIPSVHGRTDYIRVTLKEKDGHLYAHPVFGKSGLLNTMIAADGFIEIDADAEGLNADAEVLVYLF